MGSIPIDGSTSYAIQRLYRNLFPSHGVYVYAMMLLDSPIASLAVTGAVNGPPDERLEPVYGGYANGRGEIVLFAKELAYRVNFKNHILKVQPGLNAGAQARYDATEAGEEFEYGTKTFRRLSGAQIVEICAGSRFRVGLRS